jgi:hypothetical protein
VKVANAITPINQSLVVDVEEVNNLILVITHTTVEVLECFYADNIWQIKRCPQNQTLVIQHCKKTLSIIANQNHFKTNRS